MRAGKTLKRISLAIACGVACGSYSSTGIRAGEPSAEASKPPAFRTQKVTRGDLNLTVTATGTLEPEDLIDIGAQVDGQIVSFGKEGGEAGRTIDFGSIVKEGDVLAKIDDRKYRGKLESARAVLQAGQAKWALEQAKARKADADLQRIEQLVKTNAASQQELDAAKMNQEIAKAEVDLAAAEIAQRKADVFSAQTNLEYTVIRTPVNGSIITRRVNIGQTVVSSLNAPGLFLIATDLKKMQVWASINEADVGAVQAGQPAHFTVDAYPDRVFEGKVQQVRDNANLTQNVVTYTTVIAVDNADEKLRPYLTANVQIVTAKHKDVLLVPNAALRWRPLPEWIVPDARESGLPALPGGKSNQNRSLRRVWIVEGKFVRSVEVKIGPTDGVMTEITGGDLKEGTAVVTGGPSAGKTTKDTSYVPDVDWQEAMRKTVQNDPALRRSMERAAEKMQRILDRMEKNVLLVQTGAASSSGGNFGEGATVSLTAQDAESIADKCPAVLAMAPVVRGRLSLDFGHRSWSPSLIYGTTPAFLTVREWEEMAEGDIFSDRDVQACRTVCAIGETIKRELFGDESPVGKEIRIGNVPFKIVGVLSPKGANAFGLDQDDVVLAPWTTVRKRLAKNSTGGNETANVAANETNETRGRNPSGAANASPRPVNSTTIDQIFIKAVSAEKVEEATEQIKNLLRERHHIRSGGEDDFNIRDLNEVRKVVNSTQQLFNPSEPPRK